MSISSDVTKRTLGYIFWAAVVGLGLNAVRIHQPQLRATVLPSNVVPYTVILDDVAVQSDGSIVPMNRQTLAVRRDGSRAIDVTSNDPGKPFSERILNFSNGQQVYILENVRLKSTTFDPVKHTTAHWLPDPLNKCLIQGSNVQQVVGEEAVGGYRAVKLNSGPTAQWLALDYGCALIKDTADWGNGHVSEKRLVTLIAGEPSRSFFADPAGFEEVQPSCLFPGENSNAQDAYYYAHRPPPENIQP
jgi:hypothetical protein